MKCSLQNTRDLAIKKKLINQNNKLVDDSGRGMTAFNNFRAKIKNLALKKFANFPKELNPFRVEGKQVVFNESFFERVDRENIYRSNLKVSKSIQKDAEERVQEEIDNNLLDEVIYSKEIDYQLKVINALQSDKVRNPLKNFQGFINDLEKQGVPKIQLDLIRDSYKQGDTKEDLISTMLANYSYTIEINTAKGGKGEYDLNVDNFYTGFKKFERNGKYFISYLEQISDTDYETIEKEVTKEEYKSYEKPNTQYYSNLTVPGGTAYIESEIAIPDVFFTSGEIEGLINAKIEELKKSGDLEIKC